MYGFAVGTNDIFVPVFITEVAPIEVKGPSGALTEIFYTFGLMTAFTIGLGFGDISNNNDVESFEIQHYWQVVLAFPLLLSLVQILLFVFVFPYESPTVLKRRGENDDLKKIMNEIYTTEDVANERIDQILVDGEDQKSGPSYYQIYFDTKYCKATYIGTAIAILSQLTGSPIL